MKKVKSKMASQYASIDNCIRSYTKYSTDLEDVMGKCLEIAEDISELEAQDGEVATLRSSLLSLAESEVRLGQMAAATEKCKAAMRGFYESNNTEESVPNLVKVFNEELDNMSSSTSDSAKSHQALKEFKNIIQPGSRGQQSSREGEREPMDASGIIFSQVEEALYCPITKKPFEDPLRNKLCNHCYSKEAVNQMLARRNSIKCPVGGCTKQVTMENLIPDRELARRVRRKMKQDKYDRQHTADSAVQL